MTTVSELYANIQAAVLQILSTLKLIFDSAMSSMGSYAAGAMSWVTSAFQSVSEYVNESVSAVRDTIVGIYNWMTSQANAFFDFVSSIYDQVIGQIQGVFTSIGDYMRNMFTDISLWLSDMTTQIKDFFQLGYNLLKTFFTDVWEEAKSFIAMVKEEFAYQVQEFLHWANEQFDLVLKMFKQTLLDNFKWLRDLWDSFKSTMIEVTQIFKETLQDVVTYLMDTIQAIWNEVKAYIETFTDFSEVDFEAFIQRMISMQFNLMQKLAKQV